MFKLGKYFIDSRYLVWAVFRADGSLEVQLSSGLRIDFAPTEFALDEWQILRTFCERMYRSMQGALTTEYKEEE